MDEVTHIFRTFQTSNAPPSGTDDQVTTRLFPDGHRLHRAKVEPGNIISCGRIQAPMYFDFRGEDILSTDRGEGVRRLTPMLLRTITM